MWIPRRVFEHMQGEVDYLRHQLELAIDHNRRLERRQAGMPELPAEKKPKLGVMPSGIRDVLQGFDSAAIRQQMENEVWRRRRAGEQWPEIETWLDEFIAKATVAE